MANARDVQRSSADKATAVADSRASGSVPPVDENLPDMSTYPGVLHPEEEELDFVNDLYVVADRLTIEARQILPHHLNLPYGKHVKQRLDLYLPTVAPRSAPILLYLHGGGWAEGHRAHYGFIAPAYAARGIIVAVVGYRLVTDGLQYPAQADDVKQAIIWLHRNAARYGGDPASLFLSGHSAGGMLTADVGVDRSWLTSAGIDKSVLKGIAPVSGVYNLREGSLDDPADAKMYAAYAPTPELLDQASALLHLNDPSPLAVVGHGDVDAFERRTAVSSRVLFEALKGKGVQARLIELAGQTHINTVFSLATRGSPLFEAVAEMILAPNDDSTSTREAS
jgi:arylformamidase